MSHFIYAMNSVDPAPAADGDTKSWFEYYKWDVDDFAFVPVHRDPRHQAPASLSSSTAMRATSLHNEHRFRARRSSG